MMTVEVKFNDSFYKKLGVSGNTFEKSLDKAIDHVISDAENTCRREAPIKTGNLRRSIHKNKPSPCVGELRSRANYWVYLQWGTSKMPANPFVTRTAKQVAPKLPEYIIDELKNNGVI